MKKRLLATCAGIALGAVLAGNALASGYSEWAQLKSSVVGGNYVRCELYDNTAVSDWYLIGDGIFLIQTYQRLSWSVCACTIDVRAAGNQSPDAPNY